MAKSTKKTFRECVNDYTTLSSHIGNRQFVPMYLFMGEEPYFIDALGAQLAESILSPDEQAFNQTVLYGRDVGAGEVINLCRQHPMMGNLQVVIVREAQNLKRFEQLALYTAKPSPSTILVLCHKEKNVDKRSQLYKHIENKGVVFESVAPREYEIGPWITDFVRSKGYSIDPKSVAMLTDHLGSDIEKISNELSKLFTFLPEGLRQVTAEHIEQNIGISKDFNIFELNRALSERNLTHAMRIANYFARNAKENPFILTVNALFIHFQRIFILNYQKWHSRRKNIPMPPDTELAKLLKLPSPYLLKEYQQAASLYPNQQVFSILGLLREYDLKAKGVNAGQTDPGELLKELLLKILISR